MTSPALAAGSVSKRTGAREVGLANPPSLVRYKDMRFLIMDAPSDASLHLYLREFERHNVTDVVRLCNPTYSKEKVEAQGVRVHELPFADGEAPPGQVLNAFSSLCDKTFAEHSTEADGAKSERTIAVHCVAGLGRAPVLVAAAMVDHGMDPLEAVEYIRKHRRGAFNSRQIEFLEKYAKQSKKDKCTIF